MSSHSINGFFKLSQADKAALLTPGTRFITTSASPDHTNPLDGKLRLFFVQRVDRDGRLSAVAMDTPIGQVTVAKFGLDYSSEGMRILSLYKGPGFGIGQSGAAISAYVSHAMGELERCDVTAEVTAVARKITAFLAPHLQDTAIKVDEKLSADLDIASNMLNMTPMQIVKRALSGALDEMRKLEQQALHEGIFASQPPAPGSLSTAQRQLRYSAAMLEKYLCPQTGVLGEEARQLFTEASGAVELLAHGKSATTARLAGESSVEDAAEQQFLVSVVYQKWDASAYEAGVTNDQGWEMEDELMDASELQRLGRDLGLNATSTPQPSEHTYFYNKNPPENRELGIDTFYNLHVRRADGSVASSEEIAEVANWVGASFREQQPDLKKSFGMSR